MMSRFIILGMACFVGSVFLGQALAEPYVSEEFPPKEIIKYNYDKHRKWLGFTYFKTLNQEGPDEEGWYNIHFHYNRQTPLGDRGSTTDLKFKKLENGTWIMRGDGINDEVLELVEEEPPPQ